MAQTHSHDDDDDDELIFFVWAIGLDFHCTDTRIPTDKIITVYGTLTQVTCEGCGSMVELDHFCDQVRDHIKDIYRFDPTHPMSSTNSSAPLESTPILCLYCCRALVKPATVLFGRDLLNDFLDCCETDLHRLDLLIVDGTSLVDSPARTLVQNSSERTIRVVIHRELIDGAEHGFDFESANTRDLFLQGDCEDVFLELIKEMGWIDELQPDLLPPNSAVKVQKAQRDTAYQKWF